MQSEAADRSRFAATYKTPEERPQESAKGTKTGLGFLRLLRFFAAIVFSAGGNPRITCRG
jgi:hypothetical protein